MKHQRKINYAQLNVVLYRKRMAIIQPVPGPALLLLLFSTEMKIRTVDGFLREGGERISSPPPLAAALKTWSYICSPQHFCQPFSFLHLQNIFVNLQRSFLPSSSAFRSLPTKHGCRD